jgi:hypothetical protein
MRTPLTSLIIAATILCSCSPRTVSVIQHDTSWVNSTRTIRDTVVQLEPDSSIITALIECDSLGRARLKDALTERMSSRLQPIFLGLDDNLLTVKAFIDRNPVKLQVYDTRVSQGAVRTRTETEYVEVNRLKWWQTGLMYTGGACLLLSIIFLCVKLIK